MSFNFKCPHCGEIERAEDDWAGQDGQCPRCRGLFIYERRSARRRVILVSCVLLALVATAGAWFFWSHPRSRRSSTEACVDIDLTGSTVTCEFKGQTYDEATVTMGGLKFAEFTLDQPQQMAMFGVVSGKQMARNAPPESWQSFENSKTRCRILDFDGEFFLLDGDVERRNNIALFLTPGSVIENRTTAGIVVSIQTPANGSEYPLGYGETIVIRNDGRIGRKHRGVAGLLSDFIEKGIQGVPSPFGSPTYPQPRAPEDVE